MSEHSTLYQEHVLLGAEFDEEEGSQRPARVLTYLGEEDLGSLGEGALLCDLSGSCYLLAGGALASGFAAAALAGYLPAVGECAYGACLSGDGSVVGVPLLLRTGSDELVILDASPRGPVLEGWLSFLRSVEARGERPYEGVTLEDAHGTLVPLLIAGPAAHRVLLDYVAEGSGLPAAGEVAQVALDRIGALVAGVPVCGEDAPSYLVFVPAPLAQVLWRSLLSFTEVVPVGHAALEGALELRLPWGSLLRARGRVDAPRQQLVDWGLVRGDDGFVGARALRANE